MHWISIAGLGLILLLLSVGIPIWVYKERQRKSTIRRNYAQSKGLTLEDLLPNRTKISPAKRKQVCQRDGNRCVQCGSLDNLTIDHILPRAVGGGNELSNLQLLCRHCNERKGSSY